MNACPICQVAVNNSKFMCPTHWRQVPKHLQSRIYKAYDNWKAANRDENMYAKDLLAIGKALREVQQEAIKAVME